MQSVEKKQEIVDKLLERLSEIYPPGLYDYLETDEPEIERQIGEVEKLIHATIQCGTMGELKSQIKEYWQLNIKAIEKYKSRVSALKTG